MVAAALILASLVGTPAMAQNMLRNGGFEGPAADGVPQSWGFRDFSDDGRVTAEIAGGAKIGRQCLKLKAPAFPADFTAFCRPIDLDDLEADEIIFSCFFRTVDHPQPLITLATYAEDFTEREFDTPELHSESHPLGETGDWLLYTTHLRLPPGAKQLVVMLRILGGGEVFWDGVSVRPVGGEIEVDLEDAGTLTALPDQRTVRCRVRNVARREMPLRLTIEAVDQEDHHAREEESCQLAPDQARTLEVRYRFDCRSPHTLTVTLLGDRPDQIHQVWRRDVPGLVDARISEPAFRSSVLSTVPCDEILVRGRINASPELARKAQVSAYLVGTGAHCSQPEALSEDGMTGPWQLRLPTEGMLTQQYSVDVTAKIEGHEHTLSLPLVRVPHAEAEVAYDAQRRLWVNGAPILPLGIYRVADEDDLAEVSEAGFNFVITSSRLVSYRYLAAAREAGIHVAVSSATLDGQFWQYKASRYGDNEALLGWHVISLPDTKAVRFDELRQAYRKSESGPYPAIAEADLHHPILMALRPNSTAARFAELADIALAWSDPVPRWPLAMVAEAVRTTREAAGSGKPVWAIIQSSGRRWWNELSPTPPPDDRPPTPQEHRAMVYLALVSGADGVVYHAFGQPSAGTRPSYRIKRDAPELWEGIKETNRQLNWLAPVLLNAQPEPVELEYESPVVMAGWRYEDARYVVAVNAEDTTAAMAFDIGAAAGEEVEVLFEHRCIVAADSGEVGDVFEPFAVHIYQVGK